MYGLLEILFGTFICGINGDATAGFTSLARAADTVSARGGLQFLSLALWWRFTGAVLVSWSQFWGCQAATVKRVRGPMLRFFSIYGWSLGEGSFMSLLW
jgi:hypothetical protein